MKHLILLVLAFSILFTFSYAYANDSDLEITFNLPTFETIQENPFLQETCGYKTRLAEYLGLDSFQIRAPEQEFVRNGKTFRWLLAESEVSITCHNPQEKQGVLQRLNDINLLKVSSDALTSIASEIIIEDYSFPEDIVRPLEGDFSLGELRSGLSPTVQELIIGSRTDDVIAVISGNQDGYIEGAQCAKHVIGTLSALFERNFPYGHAWYLARQASDYFLKHIYETDWAANVRNQQYIPNISDSIFTHPSARDIKSFEYFWDAASKDEAKFGTLGFLFRYTKTRYHGSKANIPHSYESDETKNFTSSASHIAINRGLHTIKFIANKTASFKTLFAEKYSVPGELNFIASTSGMINSLLEKTRPQRLVNGTWEAIKVTDRVRQNEEIRFSDVFITHEITNAERKTPLSLMLASKIFAPSDVFYLNHDNVKNQAGHIISGNVQSNIPEHITGFFYIGDHDNAIDAYKAEYSERYRNKDVYEDWAYLELACFYAGINPNNLIGGEKQRLPKLRDINEFIEYIELTGGIKEHQLIAFQMMYDENKWLVLDVQKNYSQTEFVNEICPPPSETEWTYIQLRRIAATLDEIDQGLDLRIARWGSERSLQGTIFVAQRSQIEKVCQAAIEQPWREERTYAYREVLIRRNEETFSGTIDSEIVEAIEVSTGGDPEDVEYLEAIRAREFGGNADTKDKVLSRERAQELATGSEIALRSESREDREVGEQMLVETVVDAAEDLLENSGLNNKDKKKEVVSRSTRAIAEVSVEAYEFARDPIAEAPRINEEIVSPTIQKASSAATDRLDNASERMQARSDKLAQSDKAVQRLGAALFERAADFLDNTSDTIEQRINDFDSRAQDTIKMLAFTYASHKDINPQLAEKLAEEAFDLANLASQMLMGRSLEASSTGAFEVSINFTMRRYNIDRQKALVLLQNPKFAANIALQMRDTNKARYNGLAQTHGFHVSEDAVFLAVSDAHNAGESIPVGMAIQYALLKIALNENLIVPDSYKIDGNFGSNTFNLAITVLGKLKEEYGYELDWEEYALFNQRNTFKALSTLSYENLRDFYNTTFKEDIPMLLEMKHLFQLNHDNRLAQYYGFNTMMMLAENDRGNADLRRS
ncbi:MAG: hypothetical protein ABIA04_13030 [Pseudomonadota bacterium]